MRGDYLTSEILNHVISIPENSIQSIYIFIVHLYTCMPCIRDALGPCDQNNHDNLKKDM